MVVLPKLNLEGLAECIHAGRTAAAIVLTGGGTGIIPHLLRRPGGSRTVLDIAVPYSSAAVAEYLGDAPMQAVSGQTAELLAHKAFARALRFRPCHTVPIIGLGLTAALATNRDRRGADRIHIATFDGVHMATVHKEFDPSFKGRCDQETYLECLVLAALADAMGVARWADLVECDEPELIRLHKNGAQGKKRGDDELDALRDGRQPWLTVHSDGLQRPGGRLPAAVVSGSFNPLHDGHVALLAAARRRYGESVAYELSTINVDKPPLRTFEVKERLAQFEGHDRVILTAVPKFVDKARILPGVTFVMGADTAQRIVDRSYYETDRAYLDALDEFYALGTQFLVAGRLDDGRYVELGDLDISREWRGLFKSIPAEELRVDISSTTLRERLK